jgi:prepilin-type N-terminal cleavage/methylation domain-containing protein
MRSTRMRSQRLSIGVATPSAGRLPDSPRRRRWAGQRGMTLLEMMIVLAILALVMGVLVGPQVIKMFVKSQTDIARIAAHKLADEAYPAWAATNPGKHCPDTLADLAELGNQKTTTDPWGNPYKMLCGASLPPGLRGLAVSSPGEDGKDGTADDIKSWE